MYVEFEGLDKIIKEVEKIASDNEKNKVEKKILDKCAKEVEKILKPKVHKSKNPTKSGLKGLRTGKHAADNIHVDKVKIVKGVKMIKVGWDQSKNKPYSYMQWEEWGNTTREPRPILYPTIEKAQPVLRKIAEEEYQELIRGLK